MLTRYTLNISGKEMVLGSDRVKNWKDLQCAWSRKDYDGVIRSVSSKFEFVGDAYEVILSEWEKNGFSAKAVISIMTMNDNLEFDEFFRCPLDFSTMSYDSHVLTISGQDQSLASKIKAYGSTTYDLPVDEIKDSHRLKYEHLELLSSLQYKVYGDNVGDEDYESQIFDVVDLGEINSVGVGNHIGFSTIPVFYEETGDNYLFEPFDVPKWRTSSTPLDRPLLKALKDTSGLKLNFKFAASFNRVRTGGHDDTDAGVDITGDWVPASTPQIIISKVSDGQEQQLITHDLVSGVSFVVDETIEVDFAEGDSVIAYCTLPKIQPVDGNTVTKWRYEEWYLNVYKNIFQFLPSATPESSRILLIESKSVVDYGREIFLDVVKPEKLLGRLLKSITGEEISCHIQPSGEPRLDNALIVAAESVRGLQNAYLHTSYNDFCKWMIATFGYVPRIENESVEFVHRDDLFSSDEVISLTPISNDSKAKVQQSFAYSIVKVGYNHKDYNKSNGRDEFRFGVEYNTGITLSEKKLELISPYRADAYGIEFLLMDRKDVSVDTDSDNDVFFVCASLGNTGQYTFVREGYAIDGVISPETMYNVMYSPSYMIDANSRFMGVSSPRLFFASTDGNRDVKINAQPVTRDVLFSDRLFVPAEIDVTAEIGDIMPNPDALYSFVSDGRRYFGFMKEAKRDTAVNGAVKLTLILKRVELC